MLITLFPGSFSPRAAGRCGIDVTLNAPKENNMGKWTALKNSTIVKVSASAGTLVAVAVVVGAGFKWN